MLLFKEKESNKKRKKQRKLTRDELWVTVVLMPFMYKNFDGNFAPFRLIHPIPTLPRAGFPCKAKVVGRGWNKILDLHHPGGRGVGMGLHFLDPTRPALSCYAPH